MRLDRFLVARLPRASRREVRRLLDKGAVTVDGRRRSKGKPVRRGEVVEVIGTAAPPPEQWSPEPDPLLDVAVLYADDDLLAVSKPAGVACHPLRPRELGTVANGLVARYPELCQAGEVGREAGLIHRLDVDTSGALVFARRPEAFRHLVEQLRGGSAHKTYLALVEGDTRKMPERLDFPLLPRRKRVVALTSPTDARRAKALPAATWVTPLRALKGCTLVEAKIHAGRRHQIRAHLAAAGHPIIGDELYGGLLTSLGRPFLHAQRIELISPSRGTGLTIEAPLPPELAAVLERMGGFDASEP